MEFITRVDSLVEKLPQAFSGEVSVLDTVSNPDTESSSTSGGMLPVGAEDAPSTNRFRKLVLFVVAHQEAMFGEVSRSFAMGTRDSFEVF